MTREWIAIACLWLVAEPAGVAQQPPQPVPPPGFQRAMPQEVKPPQAQAVKPESQPPPAPRATATGSLNLQNASLAEVVDILCRQLKINYILDPRVKGGVYLNTYGETKLIDTRALLDMILRINGAAMIEVGSIYRIVPLADAPRLPIPPQMNVKAPPEDDQIMLNLVFLKFATVTEVNTLLEPFIGEGARTWAYVPGNLLLILDSRRNMRRTMELIGLFDSDALANQRVRLLEVRNGRPGDIAKELESIFKSIAMSDKRSPIQFLPIDRINMILAVATNSGVFEDVEQWLRKLDVEVKAPVGTVDNFVYRVKYGRAEFLAMAIMQLYGGGFGYGGMGYGGMGYGGVGGAGGGCGGFGGAGGGVGGGGYGAIGGAYGGFPGGGYGGYGGYGGGFPGGGYGGVPGAYGGFPGAMPYAPSIFTGGMSGAMAPPVTQAAGSTTTTTAPADLTGSYLGYGYAPQGRVPRVVPNIMDNSLLIQGTGQEYQQILKLLRDLDIPPRQVLIDAKIYEVSLTGAFASGVAAFVQKVGAATPGAASLATRQLTGNLSGGAVSLTVGALVGQSRELLAFLSTQEATTRAKVISAPSIIATDCIQASLNVGTEVPTLSAQAVTGIQSGGSSLFANTIQNRNSGVSLNILARVNPTGIVTLIINQEVSAPVAPPAGSIQSPSFSKRTVQTQVTLEDGDTIAIGGIISETDTESSAGIPILHRIPVIGYAFGSKSRSKERTELVVFMTPRVIYDTHQIIEASEELKSRLRRIAKIAKDW